MGKYAEYGDDGTRIDFDAEQGERWTAAEEAAELAEEIERDRQED